MFCSQGLCAVDLCWGGLQGLRECVLLDAIRLRHRESELQSHQTYHPRFLSNTHASRGVSTAQEDGVKENASGADGKRQPRLTATSVSADGAPNKAATRNTTAESKHTNSDGRSPPSKSAIYQVEESSVPPGVQKRQSAKSEVATALHNTIESIR